MADAKFTPGPWRVGKSVNGNWIEAGHVVQNISIGRTFYYNVGSAVEDANAQLIASAPDLYEALDQLSALDPEWMDGIQWDAAVAKAVSALAKARGDV